MDEAEEMGVGVGDRMNGLENVDDIEDRIDAVELSLSVDACLDLRRNGMEDTR